MCSYWWRLASRSAQGTQHQNSFGMVFREFWLCSGKFIDQRPGHRPRCKNFRMGKPFIVRRICEFYTLDELSKNARIFLISLPENATNSAVNFHDLSIFLDDAVEKKVSDIKHYNQEWDALTNENSDFRLIDCTGKIQSFASSHFDKYIIDFITKEWEPAPIVALRIMEKLDSEKQAFPGDIFIYHHLEKLCLSGAIEKQANVNIAQTLIRATSA